MHIEQVIQVTEDVAAAMGRLLPQLHAQVRRPTVADLQEVVAHPGTTLLLARDGAGQIIGTLTLVVYPMPSATLSMIDDVVVDVASRRQGAASALAVEAVRLAKERGAHQTDLLSHDRREAAIRIYKRAGFQRFDTNVFRLVHREQGQG
jgi:ribosomal protein S18 acetylase RimI-like enzyme